MAAPRAHAQEIGKLKHRPIGRPSPKSCHQATGGQRPLGRIRSVQTINSPQLGQRTECAGAGEVVSVVEGDIGKEDGNCCRIVRNLPRSPGAKKP